MSTSTITRRTTKSTKTAGKKPMAKKTQSKKTASKKASRASKPKAKTSAQAVAPVVPTFNREEYDKIKSVLGEMDADWLEDLWRSAYGCDFDEDDEEYRDEDDCGCPCRDEMIRNLADQLYGHVSEDDLSPQGLASFIRDWL